MSGGIDHGGLILCREIIKARKINPEMEIYPKLGKLNESEKIKDFMSNTSEFDNDERKSLIDVLKLTE